MCVASLVTFVPANIPFACGVTFIVSIMICFIVSCGDAWNYSQLRHVTDHFNLETINVTLGMLALMTLDPEEWNEYSESYDSPIIDNSHSSANRDLKSSGKL